jgi:hypothetical protein
VVRRSPTRFLAALLAVPADLPLEVLGEQVDCRAQLRCGLTGT